MLDYGVRKTPGNTAWFTHDRLGLFIHFGLYAMPACGEWCKLTKQISEEKYQKYFDYFNPDLFDAREWARAAKNAGMKYAVLTTKHHEGFCLFDTKYTDYKITNTSFGRDLVREYADAFRAEGLHVGLYYSLIDWHHPDFTVDRFHPRGKDNDTQNINDGRDMKKYAEYMRNQVSELLSNYGKIDILWLDFSYEGSDKWPQGKGKNEYESQKLIDLARKLQPEIIIDNRADIDQDIWTPEQYQPTEWVKHRETGEPVVWEACHTMSGLWGYNRDELKVKSPEMLIKMIIKSVSLGGNIILNVGPDARGRFDEYSEKTLKEIGKWMSLNSRSVYGCTMAMPEFKSPNGCLYTQSQDGKRLYVHLIDYPFRFLELPGLVGKIDYAQFLNDGSEIIFTENKVTSLADSYAKDLSGIVMLELPTIKPNVTIPVIELFLK